MRANSKRRSWLARLARWLLILCIGLVCAVGLRCLYAFRDRHRGYTVAVAISDQASVRQARPLQVGFGRVRINPALTDPRRPVWLAGFSQHRAATALHDDLWAMACVIEDGYTRLGVVALDAIGLFHDDVIVARQRLRPEWGLHYTVICCTHNHSTPDLMGLWGPDFLHTGLDPRYRELVIASAVEALGQAVKALQPARLACHEITVPPAGLVADTRKPEVFDADLRVLQFLDAVEPRTLGTLVTWGNHPETVWGDNTEITSDFCGYLREALERGVIEGGKQLVPGLGGSHLFINGAVGGLMSTTPRVTVQDPYLDREFKEPSHDKARAVGRQLASRLLPKLADTNVTGTPHAPISVRARTLELPLNNPVFLLAGVLGLIDRGHVRWQTLRSEVALLTLGEASIACIPGEIYPELVNGGLEQAPGGDFNLAPVEVPSLRDLMPGRFKFVFGLANDEIGYIIPKSEWDRKPPYLYGSDKPVYGEINSLGPDTARLIHAAFLKWSQPPVN